MTEKRVLVALSGGVDSSCAAFLLKKKGWKVEGVHFLIPRFIDESGKQASSSKNLNRVKSIVKKLGIKLHVVDIKKEFSKEVIKHLLDGFKRGETPNPCVVCNKKVKFKEIAKTAKKLGISRIATGHYVGKIELKTKSKGEIWFLKRAKDENKDQSYFLCRLSPAVIKKCEFPLGDLTKEEVKKIAKRQNLSI